ncbi:lysine 2,3-aminomutase, partial [Halalkalibacter kiskunsagensis]
RPYYIYQCDLSEGIGHFRAPISKGLEIIEGLRGHTSGYSVPAFVVDAPGGGGKITLQPNYMISQSPEKIVLRNFEGVITSYPEPKGYVAGRADEYFSEIYNNYEEKQSNTGISSLLNDEQRTLIPKSLERYNRRSDYQQNESYSTLKDKREKRNQLKEKKYQAELKKYNIDNSDPDQKKECKR